jgi:hypothetical protein
MESLNLLLTTPLRINKRVGIGACGLIFAASCVLGLQVRLYLHGREALQTKIAKDIQEAESECHRATSDLWNTMMLNPELRREYDKRVRDLEMQDLGTERRLFEEHGYKLGNEIIISSDAPAYERLKKIRATRDERVVQGARETMLAMFSSRFPEANQMVTAANDALRDKRERALNRALIAWQASNHTTSRIVSGIQKVIGKDEDPIGLCMLAAMLSLVGLLLLLLTPSKRS